MSVRFVTLLLFLLPVMALAQTDSLRISFNSTDTKLNKKQLQDISTFFDKGRVTRVEITGFIGGTNISKNRIAVDYRLSEVKNACLKNGVNANEIKLLRTFTQEESLLKNVDIKANFILPNKDGVVYKTDKVSISELELPRQPLRTATVKKVEKTIQDSVPKVVSRNIPKPQPVQKIESEPNKEQREYKYFDIEDFKKGKLFVIRHLKFRATRSEMLPSSFPLLKELVKILKMKPTMVIQLQGHICCRNDGEDVLDWRTNTPHLSRNRALVVCQYLVSKGIAPERLSYVGLGSRYKVADDTDSFANRALNRRVEVYIVSE